MPKLPRARDDATLMLSGRTYNKLAEASEITLSSAGVLSRGGGRSSFSGDGLFVQVVNTTGSILLPGNIVTLHQPLFTPSQPGFDSTRLCEVTFPDITKFGGVGVVRDSMPADGSGLVQIAGVVKTKVNVQKEFHRYAKIKHIVETELESCYQEDDFLILWKEAGTGQKWAWVQFHFPPDSAGPYPAVANAPISVDDTGEVTILELGLATAENNLTVHLDHMHGGQQVSAGKEVLVTYFRRERRWRIVGAECE